jgi:hypothetical protein
VSQNIVEFNVVYLVGSLSLEASVDETELLFAGLKLQVVENWTEASHVNESCAWFVFVLEKRFQKQAVIPNMSSKTLKTVIQHNVFVIT